MGEDWDGNKVSGNGWGWEKINSCAVLWHWHSGGMYSYPDIVTIQYVQEGRSVHGVWKYR